MVSQLVYIKVVSYSAAEGRDHVLDFVGIEDFVEARLFNVEYLTSERKYGLAYSVASLFCGASCGISLYEEYFGFCRILFGAVGQLSRKRDAVEDALSSRKLSGLSCRLSRAGSSETFIQDYPRLGRVFLQERHKVFAGGGFDKAPYFAVSELCLSLSFELRLSQLYGHYACKTFSYVLAGQGVVVVL